MNFFMDLFKAGDFPVLMLTFDLYSPLSYILDYLNKWEARKRVGGQDEEGEGSEERAFGVRRYSVGRVEMN